MRQKPKRQAESAGLPAALFSRAADRAGPGSAREGSGVRDDRYQRRPLHRSCPHLRRKRRRSGILAEAIPRASVGKPCGKSISSLPCMAGKTMNCCSRLPAASGSIPHCRSSHYADWAHHSRIRKIFLMNRSGVRRELKPRGGNTSTSSGYLSHRSSSMSIPSEKNGTRVGHVVLPSCLPSCFARFAGDHCQVATLSAKRSNRLHRRLTPVSRARGHR
jgi:hypothetical protein